MFESPSGLVITREVMVQGWPILLVTRDAVSSLATATRFEREARAGLIHVNSQTAGADVQVPFKGINGSGFGPQEQGRSAIEFYTDGVTVYVDP